MESITALQQRKLAFSCARGVKVLFPNEDVHELDVVVLPQQDDEFTCVNCFLVRHRSQLDHESELGPICAECAA